MKYPDLKDRTRRFGLDIIEFCKTLPDDPTFWILKKQIIRCATSVGANYRSACRGKSMPDFIAKLAIVEEEADEAQYWLEVIRELEPHRRNQIMALHQEAGEIVAIMIASKKTARSNLHKK